MYILASTLISKMLTYIHLHVHVCSLHTYVYMHIHTITPVHKGGLYLAVSPVQ